jgi:hypothetical protein
MGVLVPGSSHARPSALPPKPLLSHIRSFGTLGQLLKIPPFQLIVREKRGVPINLLAWNPFSFFS